MQILVTKLITCLIRYSTHVSHKTIQKGSPLKPAFAILKIKINFRLIFPIVSQASRRGFHSALVYPSGGSFSWFQH